MAHDSRSKPDRPRQWTPLPRERLSPAGDRRHDSFRWMGVGAATALALAGVWWAWCLFRPLPKVQPVDIDPPAQAPSYERSSTPIERRRERLAALTAMGNAFAPGREAWKGLPAAELADGQPSPDSSVKNPSGGTAGEMVQTSGSPLPVLAMSEVSSDLRAALEAIELKGIFRDPRAPADDPSGGLVAMIGLVHTKDRNVSMWVRRGDRFSDKPDEEKTAAQWEVMHIDGKTDRVILRREGKNVALPLYKGEFASVPVPAAAPEAAGPVGPRIESISREEALKKLREAGVSDADIQTLARMLDMSEEEFRALAAAAGEEETARELKRLAEDSSMPAGMEEILRIMASGKSPLEAPEPPPPSDAEPVEDEKPEKETPQGT